MPKNEKMPFAVCAKQDQLLDVGGGFKRDLCVTQSRAKSHWPRSPIPACISPRHEYNTCLMEWAESPPTPSGDPTQGFNMTSTQVLYSLRNFAVDRVEANGR